MCRITSYFRQKIFQTFRFRSVSFCNFLGPVRMPVSVPVFEPISLSSTVLLSYKAPCWGQHLHLKNMNFLSHYAVSKDMTEQLGKYKSKNTVPNRGNLFDDLSTFDWLRLVCAVTGFFSSPFLLLTIDCD